MDYAQQEEEYMKVLDREIDATEAFLCNLDPTKHEELQNNYIEAVTRLFEFENRREAHRKHYRRLKKLKEAVNDNWHGIKVIEPDYKLTKKQQKFIQQALKAYNRHFQYRLQLAEKKGDSHENSII